MSRFALILCLAILGLAASAFAGFKWVERSDFDRMCAVATSGLTDPDLAKMDSNLRAATLARRTMAVLYAPPAIAAFHAIALADPASRMALMRSAAEEVRGGPWACPAMVQIFGPFKN